MMSLALVTRRLAQVSLSSSSLPIKALTAHAAPTVRTFAAASNSKKKKNQERKSKKGPSVEVDDVSNSASRRSGKGQCY
jgi:hypothetical protein